MVILVVSWVAAAMVFTLLLDGRSIDDYFITYRYAQNLAHGNGLVFNPGERVFGTTAPGLALLLALLNVLTRVPVPVLGTAITGLSLVLIAAMLLWEGRRRRRLLETSLAGTWLVGCTFLWLYHGSETPLAIAMLVAAALAAERLPVAAGLLAGFAVWLRPECGIGTAWLGVMLWYERRRLPWRYGAAAASVIGAGLLAAWWWFGQPLPATLGAKQLQAGSQLGAWQSGLGFWPAAVRHFGAKYAGAGTPYLVAGGLLGLPVMLALPSRALRLVGLLACSLVVAYPALGVSFYPWYAIPVVVALLYGLCFLAGGVGRLVARWIPPSRRRPLLARAVVALVCAAALAPALASVVPTSASHLKHFNIYSLRYFLYRDVALWIRANSNPDDDIGYVEVGTVGYWSQRPIRDLLGLVTPESVPYVTAGDLADAFLVKPPALVIRHAAIKMMDRVCNHRWFRRAYRQVAVFALAGGVERVTVYRRLPDAELPAAGPPP